MPLTPYHAYTHERNFGCRVSEWTLKGYRALVLENNLIRCTVLAGRGTSIYELLYKPLDLDIMFRTPIGLVDLHANQGPRPLENGPQLDNFFGGWFEMFPNAGYHFEAHGMPWGLHGEASLLSWDAVVIDDRPEEVAVRFRARTFRTLFALEKTIRLRYDQPTLFFEERITHLGAQPLDASWGQHPCFGWPFVDETCRVYLPPCRALTLPEIVAPSTRFAPGQDTPWPYLRGRDGCTIDASRIPGPQAAAQDHVFLTGYDQGWYAVSNERLGLGFGMRFDPQLFPYMMFWQVYRGAFDYPWWGTTYNIALEPQTSFPNTLPEQIAAGNALHFEAGASVATTYLATFYRQPGVVQGIDEQGQVG